MYNSILIPIDLEDLEHGLKAVRAARAIAGDGDTRLTLLNVVQKLSNYASTFFPADFERRASDDAAQRLRAIAGQELDGVDVGEIVAHGSIYDEILHTREAVGADLIVMASHRPELSDYLLGPNAARVVRHARCSVLVVRD